MMAIERFTGNSLCAIRQAMLRWKNENPDKVILEEQEPYYAGGGSSGGPYSPTTFSHLEAEIIYADAEPRCQ
jgi:hypothetical protein